jgi:hypothetical protein
VIGPDQKAAMNEAAQPNYPGYYKNGGDPALLAEFGNGDTIDVT